MPIQITKNIYCEKEAAVYFVLAFPYVSARCPTCGTRVYAEQDRICHSCNQPISFKDYLFVKRRMINS